MTPADHKQRIQAAAERFYEADERERLGLRKKREYIGSEASEQTKLAAWLDRNGVIWAHPANEAKRTAWGHASMRNQGLKAGLPDVLIFGQPRAWDGAAVHGTMGAFYNHPRGVAIELKRVSSKATLSVAQYEWIERLRECGWLAKVCCGASEAIHYLESLGFGAP